MIISPLLLSPSRKGSAPYTDKTPELARALISSMLHPDSHKRGGYFDSKLVTTMPYFAVRDLPFYFPAISPHGDCPPFFFASQLSIATTCNISTPAPISSSHLII